MEEGMLMKLFMKLFLKRNILIVVTILSIVFVGCQSDLVNNDSDKRQDETDYTGGSSVLNIAIDATPPTLDQPRTAATATRDTSRLMFESLITTDENFEPTPMLAESYEISGDNKTYTFHLRKGIKFHNGKE